MGVCNGQTKTNNVQTKWKNSASIRCQTSANRNELICYTRNRLKRKYTFFSPLSYWNCFPAWQGQACPKAGTTPLTWLAPDQSMMHSHHLEEYVKPLWDVCVPCFPWSSLAVPSVTPALSGTPNTRERTHLLEVTFTNTSAEDRQWAEGQQIKDDSNLRIRLRTSNRQTAWIEGMSSPCVEIPKLKQ